MTNRMHSRCVSPVRSSRKTRSLTLALSLAATLAGRVAATDLTELSLEQLLEVPIIGASKYEQKLSEVAASASVISRSEIRTFGWRTLDEALASLPGVHTTYDRQYAYLGTRAHIQSPGSRNNWQNALEQDGRSFRFKLSYRF